MQPSSSIDRACAFSFPHSLSLSSTTALARDTTTFPVNGAASAAGLHSTFSLSIGNFYLEDLHRSKSTLGYFEQLTSLTSVAYRLLNPLANEPQTNHH